MIPFIKGVYPSDPSLLAVYVSSVRHFLRCLSLKPSCSQSVLERGWRSIMERSYESSWGFWSMALLSLLSVSVAVPVEQIHGNLEPSSVHIHFRRSLLIFYQSHISRQNSSVDKRDFSLSSRLPHYRSHPSDAMEFSINDSNETDSGNLPTTVSPHTTVQNTQSEIPGVNPSSSPSSVTTKFTPYPNSVTPVPSPTSSNSDSSNLDTDPTEDDNKKSPTVSISPNPAPSNFNEAGQNQPLASGHPIPSSSPKPSEQDETTKSPPKPASDSNENNNENKHEGDDNGDDERSSPHTKPAQSRDLMSFPFLCGFGVLMLAIGTTVYFVRKSDLCGGRRRSMAGQPYESVHRDDPDALQPNNSLVESGEPVDADGWNDGWDDDWEPNSRPKAESLNV